LEEDIGSTYRQLRLLKEADVEKRYQIFLKEYKHVYNEISDRMIASFLGVHYTTLSRVKARLLEKSKLNV
jgi:CRP-like cAMP-binding protein